MIVILLLVSRAALAEWVEISQQHYRKPVRTNFNFPAVEKVIELPQTVKPQTIYTNESLQHVWTKGNVNKVPKLGSVQRVQLDSNPVKAPSLHGPWMTSAKAPMDHINKNNNRETGIVPKKTRQEDYNLDGSFEFNMESSSTNSVRNVDRYKDNTRDDDNERNEKFKTNKIIEEHKIATNRHNSRLASSTKTKETEQDVTKSKKQNTRPPTTSAIEVFTDAKRQNNQNENSHAEKKSHQRPNQNIIKGVVAKTSSTTDDTVTTVTTENVHVENTAESPTKTSKDNKGNHQKHNIDRDHPESPNDRKTSAVENLVKFVKVVADTIRRNTRRSVTSKTKYLENLKDSILGNIEDHINAAWPDDSDPPAPARNRRAAQASPRGHSHVQIPSSESALMTISFLTFAVFLIKLVLQVIQTYKNKAMMVAPTVVATVGRTARKNSKSKP